MYICLYSDLGIKNVRMVGGLYFRGLLTEVPLLRFKFWGKYIVILAFLKSERPKNINLFCSCSVNIENIYCTPAESWLANFPLPRLSAQTSGEGGGGNGGWRRFPDLLSSLEGGNRIRWMWDFYRCEWRTFNKSLPRYLHTKLILSQDRKTTRLQKWRVLWKDIYGKWGRSVNVVVKEIFRDIFSRSQLAPSVAPLANLFSKQAFNLLRYSWFGSKDIRDNPG
jgi:hypothetical protein